MANVNDKQKLKDPVENISKSATLADEIKGLDPDQAVVNGQEQSIFLDPSEAGMIQDRKTSSPHPFEGYQLGRNIQVDGFQISSTYVVLLKPTDEPPPDASNANITVYMSKEAGGGGKPGTGIAKTITFPTSHTRVVTNRQGSQNESVVFDRELVMADGRTFKCAVVRGHAARAQICFTWDGQRNRAIADKRYMLADMRQASVLLRMFEAVFYQRSKAERAAKEFDAAKETTAVDR